jgi:hypothetical protein
MLPRLYRPNGRREDFKKYGQWARILEMRARQISKIRRYDAVRRMKPIYGDLALLTIGVPQTSSVFCARFCIPYDSLRRRIGKHLCVFFCG